MFFFFFVFFVVVVFVFFIRGIDLSLDVLEIFGELFIFSLFIYLF